MSLCREIDAAQDQYIVPERTGTYYTGFGNFTFEWWLKADAYPTAGNEVVLFRGDASISTGIVLIKIINDGTLKLYAHIQSNNNGLAPGATEHVTAEFDISGLVSASAWEYLALKATLANAPATFYELFHGDEVTTPTSQGNGSVISGTDFIGTVPTFTSGGVRVLGDGGAGRSFDGRAFRFMVWLDNRTLAEIQTNYKLIFNHPETDVFLLGQYWTGGRHDQDRSQRENNLRQAANTGAPLFQLDMPSGMVTDLASVGASVTVGGPSGKRLNGGYRAGLTSPGPASVTAGGPSGKATNGGYRAGLNASEGADVWYIGSTAAAAGTGTTFPPLQTDQKSQFISTEPLEIALHPFISAVNGQFILGTDTASVQVVKPDNTLYGAPPTLTWDSGIERWKGEIPISAFQEGEWLLYFTSNDPNALPQWLMLWWGDYMDDVPEIRQAALGRWRIIGTQLVLYEDDLTTVFRTFDLRDSLGDPSSANIFDKDPVP